MPPRLCRGVLFGGRYQMPPRTPLRAARNTPRGTQRARPLWRESPTAGKQPTGLFSLRPFDSRHLLIKKPNLPMRCMGRFGLEQMTGIEPAYSAWEADTLPLSYICVLDYCSTLFTKMEGVFRKNRKNFYDTRLTSVHDFAVGGLHFVEK